MCLQAELTLRHFGRPRLWPRINGLHSHAWQSHALHTDCCHDCYYHYCYHHQYHYHHHCHYHYHYRYLSHYHHHYRSHSHITIIIIIVVSHVDISCMLWCCRGCFGGTSTTGEHEGHDLPSARPASRADLAAEHELNPLAAVRETEAEEDFEDAVRRSEEERQSQPFRRRFGVRFTHLSEHLPSITHHLPKFARSSRDNDLARESHDGNVEKGLKGESAEWEVLKQSAAEQRSSGQHAAAPAEPQAGQLPTAHLHLYPQQSAGVLDANSSTEGQQAAVPGHVPPGQLSDFPILSETTHSMVLPAGAGQHIMNSSQAEQIAAAAGHDSHCDRPRQSSAAQPKSTAIC